MVFSPTSCRSGSTTPRPARTVRSRATRRGRTSRTCGPSRKGPSSASPRASPSIPFSAEINKGIYRLADELGYEVVYCDNNFDPNLAVSCAETIAQQQPDFVVESNWQAGAAQSVMDIFDAAKIPVATIDVVHPNAIFVGADNWTSGYTAGQAAGGYALAQDRCADVWILTGRQPR